MSRLSVTKSAVRGFVHNLISPLYGTGAAPHEPYAGAWQESSRTGSGACAPKSSLAHSAVYTCINNISSDLAKLTLRVMRPRALPAGSPTSLEEHSLHPIAALLKKPNRYQTSYQFLQYYFMSKLYRGNTYILLFRDGRGVPDQMHILHPDDTTVVLDTEGDVWYRIKATPLNRLGEDQYVPSRNVIHDRAVCLFHPLVGVSPLFAAGVSASIGNSITSNSDMFFKNMSRSSGVLTSPGEIPKPIADRLKAEWDNNYNGLGFGKVAVLGSGLEWKPLTINAVDAQLVEQLRFSVEDVARVYRVPYFMLAESKQTHRSSEQSARLYFQGCLSSHIESAEQCFTGKFELSGGSVVRFDTSSLFRLETDLRFESHQKALTSGIKSINEVRAEEDLPPVKGGESPRLQMQYVPIDTPPVETPGPAPATADTPAEEVDEPTPPQDEKASAEELREYAEWAAKLYTAEQTP